MNHRLQCVGHEGHECGKVVYHNRRLVAPRCAECKRMHDNERARRAHQDYRTTVPVSRQKPTAAELKERRQKYQREYYLAHREHAQIYQREYNLTHKKHRGPRVSTPNDSGRPRYKTDFTHSDLMQLSPEKMERAIRRMSQGQATMAAVK